MRLFTLLLFCTSLLFSHNLQHTVSKEQSVVVTFSFAQEDDFSFQSYEIYAPEGEIPFAVGRTDALSRISFLPDRPGLWKIKAFSQDGHGKIVEVAVDEAMQTQIKIDKSTLFQKALIGIVVLFAVFGLLYIIARKKNEKV